MCEEKEEKKLNGQQCFSPIFDRICTELYHYFNSIEELESYYYNLHCFVISRICFDHKKSFVCIKYKNGDAVLDICPIYFDGGHYAYLSNELSDMATKEMNAFENLKNRSIKIRPGLYVKSLKCLNRLSENSIKERIASFLFNNVSNTNVTWDAVNQLIVFNSFANENRNFHSDKITQIINLILYLLIFYSDSSLYKYFESELHNHLSSDKEIDLKILFQEILQELKNNFKSIADMLSEHPDIPILDLLNKHKIIGKKSQTKDFMYCFKKVFDSTDKTDRQIKEGNDILINLIIEARKSKSFLD